MWSGLENCELFLLFCMFFMLFVGYSKMGFLVSKIICCFDYEGINFDYSI